MGVYIKGIEMPKSCDECRIMVFEDTNCAPELYCGCPIVFKAHPQGIDHRPDYCPLVHVPPHGDLIDRDSLMDSDGDLWDGMCGWSSVQIANAPTIIPAEEGET